MTCAYGVHVVGRVLIVFGICDALASALSGILIKWVGRIPIFIVGACINYGVILVMLLWQPSVSASWLGTSHKHRRNLIKIP